MILILPELDLENSKTKSIRMVPVNDHLAALLLDHLNGANPECFAFGNPFDTKRKAGRKGAVRLDYFRPSRNQIKRDTATKLWNSLVMDGMEIKKHQYALKRTGGNDKILAGIRWML